MVRLLLGVISALIAAGAFFVVSVPGEERRERAVRDGERATPILGMEQQQRRPVEPGVVSSEESAGTPDPTELAPAGDDPRVSSPSGAAVPVAPEPAGAPTEKRAPLPFSRNFRAYRAKLLEAGLIAASDFQTFNSHREMESFLNKVVDYELSRGALDAERASRIRAFLRKSYDEIERGILRARVIIPPSR